MVGLGFWAGGGSDVVDEGSFLLGTDFSLVNVAKGSVEMVGLISTGSDVGKVVMVDEV